MEQEREQNKEQNMEGLWLPLQRRYQFLLHVLGEMAISYLAAAPQNVNLSDFQVQI